MSDKREGMDKPMTIADRLRMIASWHPEHRHDLEEAADALDAPPSLPEDRKREAEIREKCAQASNDITTYGHTAYPVQDVAWLLSQLAEARRLARRYQMIAGACLSGTDQVDKIAAENENPNDAFNAAMALHSKRLDDTCEAWVRPLKEQLAEARLALAEVETPRIRELEDCCNGLLDEKQKLLDRLSKARIEAIEKIRPT